MVGQRERYDTEGESDLSKPFRLQAKDLFYCKRA